MYFFDCPKCNKENEIEGEDLPTDCCDTELYECQHCGIYLQVGWEASITVTIDKEVDV